MQREVDPLKLIYNGTKQQTVHITTINWTSTDICQAEPQKL